jgi:hypothetical protein
MEPRQIYVSGLPLLWRGCNGEYTRTTYLVKKQPFIEEIHTVYHKPEGSYLGIRVPECTIAVDTGNGRWHLKCGERVLACSPDMLEYGEWGNCLVTRAPSLRTWWRSNNFYVITALFLAVFWLSQ